MAVDLTVGSSAGAAFTAPRAYTIEVVLDFADTSRLASDSPFQIIDIPAHSEVAVYYEVLTIEDSTLTFDIGDNAAANGFASNINGETLAVGKADASSFGVYKVYTAADTLDVTLDNNADSGKVRIQARIINYAGESGIDVTTP